MSDTRIFPRGGQAIIDARGRLVPPSIFRLGASSKIRSYRVKRGSEDVAKGEVSECAGTWELGPGDPLLLSLPRGVFREGGIYAYELGNTWGAHLRMRVYTRGFCAWKFGLYVRGRAGTMWLEFPSGSAAFPVDTEEFIIGKAQVHFR